MGESLEREDRGGRSGRKGISGRLVRTLGAAGIASFVSAGEVPSVKASEVPQHSVTELKRDKLRSPALERARLIAAEVEKVRKRLRSPLVKEALQGKGPDPVARVVDAIEIPVVDYKLRGVSIEGTSYDLRELHRRFPVQVKVGRPAEQIIPSYTNNSGKSAYIKGGYGNGFYWDNRNTLMTTRHVVNGGQDIEANTSIDVDLVTLPANLAAVSDEQVLRDDGTLTNGDIHGALVAIVGIDPDRSSDERGHKTFLGVAARATEAFYQRLNPELTTDWTTHLTNSFMVLLPPLETAESSRGLSGSHVFVWKGQWKFAGVFWSAVPVPISGQNRTVTIAQFHGIDDIRKGQKERGPTAGK